MKPAILTVRAQAGVDDAVVFYLTEAPHVAEGFVAALAKSAAQIERQPGIGSPRYAHELNIPQLRHWRLSRFPYAVFYLEHLSHLDLIRLLHLSRDIPHSMLEQ